MQSFDDEDDFEASQDGASGDEQDQNDEDGDQEENDDGDEDDGADADADDGEVDGDNDADNDGDGEDAADEDDEQESTSPSASKRSLPADSTPKSLGDVPVLAPPRTHADGAQQSSSSDGSKIPFWGVMRPEALSATEYDIVPTIAAPHATSINVVTAMPTMRWVFSGGSDGYIRKFDWIGTANNKLPLTVAQRSNLVDTITKAGICLSYWENTDPGAKSSELDKDLSPVYSLAVHSQAVWLVAGCESGAINLQTVRHGEGETVHRLKEHTSAVSVLQISQDEHQLLSGSWDKTIAHWDLDTGKIIRKYKGNTSQISALEMRPLSSVPVPKFEEAPVQSTTISSNNAVRPRMNGIDSNEKGEIGDVSNGNEAVGGPSPADSLFGGQDNDSLFGGGDDAANAPLFGEDDEFSRDIARNLNADNDVDAPGDVDMSGHEIEEPLMVTAVDDNKDKESSLATTIKGDEEQDIPSMNDGKDNEGKEPSIVTGVKSDAVDAGAATSPAKADRLPEDVEMPDADTKVAEDINDKQVSDSTFLSASIDGTLRVWDKRMSEAIAKISLPRNTPPWCMGACWSPDGNYIYAGRRNATVEEFSLHKGLQTPERSFKFPTGSGAVSAVRAMPNGRHLICASYDTLRLYDLQQQANTSVPPFLVVSGHRTGIISQLYIDPACRFLISTAGSRGWEGQSTQLLLGYEINI